MGERIDARELRRRAVEGIRDEVEAFGSGHPDSRLIRRDGLLASLAPAAPKRSLFNSVFYEDPAVLAAALDSLATLYDSHGVVAWTVWVPDEDRETARLLADRGHALDAAPRAMAMELSAPLLVPPPPSDIDGEPCEAAVGAEINDLAYGYGRDGFRAAVAGETSIRWQAAREGGEPIACVGTIAVGDDCCVTGVATLPEYRGHGIAGWLLRRTLAEARAQGMRTASLQATRAGVPLYERIGFADLGYVEMWESRR